MTNSDLLMAESHFAFGENWKSFLNLIDQKHIDHAEEGLRRLFPNNELSGATMLDIGCGSGLSALSAINLGAAHVDCVDIDASSVEATQRLLSKFAQADKWAANVVSIFDLDPAKTYDIVHSWGVLHHTGDMWRAINAASKNVRPGGLLAIALYRKTPFCGVWKMEKSIYRRLPSFVQLPLSYLYIGAYLTLSALIGRNPMKIVRDYGEKRGMSLRHDVHDWLGGYPYESIRPDELKTFLTERNFGESRAFLGSSPLWGLFGSGCDEFVYKKR